MESRNLITLFIILLVAALAVFIALPISHPAWFTNLVAGHQSSELALQLRLGLDLQGGTQVQLEPDLPDERTATTEEIDLARRIIERRVNGLGVAEPLIQTSGERIIVALPGVTDPDQAIDTLRGTGQLEFVEPGSNPALVEGDVIVTSLDTSKATTDTVVYTTIMTGDQLSTVDVARNETTGEIYIAFELKSEGAGLFADYTGAHIGDPLAIVLDKTVLSVPVIQDRIPDGSGTITGNHEDASGQLVPGFDLEEARSLAIQMQYGALPLPLQVVDVRTVGPSLGEDSVRSSVTAGAIGLVVVLLFMLIYYRLPGFLADLALISYAALNIMIYKLVPVVLTLPGIAGFLLSTGMAVDANILIFERMKEELRGGKSLGNAVEAGFARAWTSILDSNLSTLITCVILFYFGSNFGASIVQGFAVTLGLGVAISMLTAVFFTRTFMRFVVGLLGPRLRQRLALFGA